jgi:hypothetical protein
MHGQLPNHHVLASGSLSNRIPPAANLQQPTTRNQALQPREQLLTLISTHTKLAHELFKTRCVPGLPLDFFKND